MLYDELFELWAGGYPEDELAVHDIYVELGKIGILDKIDGTKKMLLQELAKARDE